MSKVAGHRQSVRRFAGAKADPATARGLNADHAALAEGRTIFPTTVVPSLDSPRFLVSGHNNPKLGKQVLKGPRAGWPIYHLTLEERATCPRTCAQWATCYGNAMPHSRRHTPDSNFAFLLKSEVATVARQHPHGLLIRLHALGDFYSVQYVELWARLLMAFPQVHVFGYTARRTDDADPASAKIARAVEKLTQGAWGRFAVRTSSDRPTASPRATVVRADPHEPDTIVCPAQTGATEACATCGLCWTAPGKTIAFLMHGMTSRRSEPRPTGLSDNQAKVYRVITDRAVGGEVSMSLRDIATTAGVSQGSMGFITERLAHKALISVQRGHGRKANLIRLIKPQARTEPDDLAKWRQLGGAAVQ